MKEPFDNQHLLVLLVAVLRLTLTAVTLGLAVGLVL
jgi:hypothetical protein